MCVLKILLCFCNTLSFGNAAGVKIGNAMAGNLVQVVLIGLTTDNVDNFVERDFRVLVAVGGQVVP